MKPNPQGLIAATIEAYTARACSRIARMIELQIRKYPEAEEALANLAEQIRLYSLVFGPADPEHPERAQVQTIRRTYTRMAPAPRGTKTENILTLLREGGRTASEIAIATGATPAMVYVVKSKYRDLLNEPGRTGSGKL